MRLDCLDDVECTVVGCQEEREDYEIVGKHNTGIAQHQHLETAVVLQWNWREREGEIERSLHSLCLLVDPLVEHLQSLAHTSQ